MSRVLVVGPGRAGAALARIHADRGDEVLVVGRRDGAWRRRIRRFGCRTALRPPLEIPPILILAVPDSKLVEVARNLARAVGRCPPELAVHLSGLHGLAPLAPFADRGARVAAAHPVLPFPARPGPEVLRGIPVSILAGAGAGAAVSRLVRTWGARPLSLPPGTDRRRYHLALALAANGVTGLLDWAAEILGRELGPAGPEIVLGLAGQALARCAEDGPAVALTGPVVRGDLPALAAHFAALRGRERRSYAALVRLLADRAERAGRLTKARARAIRRLARRHE
ncbi:MAG: DUF2520 domain-containing protein [Planctomycetota bacterium]|nr:MAG: DUF2520 domain-containing protein [Planctomycetota bacterium]